MTDVIRIVDYKIIGIGKWNLRDTEKYYSDNRVFYVFYGMGVLKNYFTF